MKRESQLVRDRDAAAEPWPLLNNRLPNISGLNNAMIVTHEISQLKTGISG
jgi:hypothetical protein